MIDCERVLKYNVRNCTYACRYANFVWHYFRYSFCSYLLVITNSLLWKIAMPNRQNIEVNQPCVQYIAASHCQMATPYPMKWLVDQLIVNHHSSPCGDYRHYMPHPCGIPIRNHF